MNIVLIFAAGKGSRLAPLTNTLPKPLAPITETESIIERHMRLLAPYTDRFIVVTHYLEEQIHHRIGSAFHDTPVAYVHQDNPKWWTGDCLRVGLANQGIEPDDQIFITNADEVLSQDVYRQIGAAFTSGSDFLLGQKLDDREKLKQFGIIQLRDDRFYDVIIEKPQHYVSDLVNIGMYSVSWDILKYIPESKPAHLAPDQEEYIFLSLDPYAADHDMSVLKTRDWLTVSSVEHLNYVQDFLCDNPDF